MPIIDFHSHILPGIDDGSESVNMSLGMLKKMRDSGIDYVVATPHFYNKKESMDTFLSRRNAAFEKLKCEIIKTETFPEILLGAEVALTSSMEGTEFRKLCIENSDVILIEMPYSPWTDIEFSALENICFDKKLTVILAHLERFLFVQNKDNFNQIMRLPLFFQINSGSFDNFFLRRKIVSLLKNDTSYILGSDSHNLTSRKPDLNTARDFLRKKRTDILQNIDDNGEFLLNKILCPDISIVE